MFLKIPFGPFILSWNVVMSVHQRRIKMLPGLGPSGQVVPIVDCLQISGTGGEHWEQWGFGWGTQMPGILPFQK